MNRWKLEPHEDGAGRLHLGFFDAVLDAEEVLVVATVLRVHQVELGVLAVDLAAARSRIAPLVVLQQLVLLLQLVRQPVLAQNAHLTGRGSGFAVRSHW